MDQVRSSEGELDRRAASRDCWPGGTLRAWHGEPAVLPERVFWPESEDDVLLVLREASRRGIPVVPYGAGSGVCGGAGGRSGAWVLDTKAMAGIGPLDVDRRTVRVQAGVNGQQLEDWLGQRGFTLGHSPSSIACSTVGGWAAARSAGQFSSRYGVFEDMVLGLRAVAPGPGIFEVGPAGDAPAEWLELLLGSEGTLAVVTEVELRVWPIPAARWLRGYRFPDVASTLDAMRRLMQGELHPAVVRLYDPVDTRIGGRTRPKKHDAEPSASSRLFRRWLARVDAMPEVHRRSLVLPLSLPGLVNRLFDRLASGCLLIVGWEGDADVVAAASTAGHTILCEQGEDLGEEPGQRWFASRHAVSYKLMPIFERGGFADTMEVAARWSELEATYRAVRAAVSRTAVVMAHMSHVYPEGGCIYFSFAGHGDERTYTRTWDAALEAVVASGATVTHHHGVGALKARAASREVGPAAAVWRRFKAELDPSGVLNPGRLFVEVPPEDPGPAPALRENDGLARSPVEAPLSARPAEPAWPWERLPGPPRWQRDPWQTPWIEVAGSFEGRRFLLGRGPRSASGPDLRPSVAGPGATATWAVAAPGPRWMGEGRPSSPWRVARDLLRSDLRPAVLTVVDGALRVGFRGPCAARFGEIAASRVPGGLVAIPYVAAALPSLDLEPCPVDDPAVVSVTLHDTFRRRPEPS